MGFALPTEAMRPTPDSDALPRRRARGILTALLILLLILLPLYLWPLRGATTGPRRAAALPGALLDPRSARDVARIPGEVWNALMGQRDEPPVVSSSPKPPRNLTMIAEIEDVARGEIADVTAGPRTPQIESLLDDVSLPLEGNAGGDGSSSSPVHFLTTPSPDEQGTGNGSAGFGSGGYPGFSNLGPWGGGGSGGRNGRAPLVISSDPGWNSSEPGSPAPTPEPTTMVLVGSNLTWLSVMAWKRRRRRLSI